MEIVNPQIEAYATAHSSPPTANLEEVASRTSAEHEDAQMMVGRLEGAFLEMLVHAVGARLVLEVGTFTGYSAISMAAALPAGGRIVTCEVDPEHAAHARENIEASGFAGRIELREGPALDTIAGLEGPFDLVFIDADKTGYGDYYEAVLPKLAAHGLIAADNTLRGGAVLEPNPETDATRAIQQFNDAVVSDPRVRCAQLPVRDGVTLIRRLPSS
ncbi:MAG TPA: class I SAM-dependent methyltransferase [Acidimicrobiales bacterium]|nr:class I SAM-dependent methyltransferase [Acidimicrobiales bacterium]